jgi:hypothetical protein
MSCEETHEPTVAGVAMDLAILVETHDPTDDDLELLAGPLLGLGTRTQWRDAFFYADLDGEDQPVDHLAIPIPACDLTLEELTGILTWYPLTRLAGHRHVAALATALLPIASPAAWRAAFSAIDQAWE